MTAQLGLISDLHVLSRFGLVPPEWRQKRDPLRTVQHYLWGCYQDFVTRCPPLDVLLVVGDVVEGTVQLRGEPRGSASDDATDQLDACEETLRPLCAKAKRVYLVSGTPFHDAHGDRMEDLGRRLKTVPWAPGNRHAGHVLNLRWQGLTINASHHNTRGWQWIGGATSRMAVLAAAAESAGKLPHADIIVRGDLHTFFAAQTLDKQIILLPGWTMPNPHAVRKMEAIRAYLATDIGAVVVSVSKDGVAVKPYMYPLCAGEVNIA